MYAESKGDDLIVVPQPTEEELIAQGVFSELSEAERELDRAVEKLRAAQDRYAPYRAKDTAKKYLGKYFKFRPDPDDIRWHEFYYVSSVSKNGQYITAMKVAAEPDGCLSLCFEYLIHISNIEKCEISCREDFAAACRRILSLAEKGLSICADVPLV